MTEVNQQRIAKNTLLLYVRMVVVMLVGLYTSRVIIDSLGQEHYGVYDAVGGIVLMASFFSATMSAACQRFYSYEMGKGNIDRLKTVFSISLSVYFILAAFVILLAETIGYWWLINKMDVAGHTYAARWVYQFSILAFVLMILRMPYNGMIVAKEKMKVYAYLSLFEAFATLAIAVTLAHSPDDKDNRLILYSGLMAGIQLMTSLFYWCYCRLFYAECKFRFVMDKVIIKDIFSYAGWNMIGSLADVFKNSGVNILLNVTFGPLVNAARGVAYKVFNTITQLNTNFFTAVRPQIYKSYAAGNIKDVHKLVCQGTKISFFLLFLLALPILIETDFILPIWLRGRNVPEYAYILTKLLVIEGLLNCFTEPLASAVQATGNIRNYKIVLGGTLLLILPISYLGVKYAGFSPASIFMTSIIVTIITQIERIWFVKRQVGFDIWNFLKTVILPMAVVTVICFSLSLLVKEWMLHVEFSKEWMGHAIVIAASMLIECITVYLIGVNATERKQILNIIRNFLKKENKD